MLKPSVNVFSIFESLPAVFGTKTDPHWCLLFNSYLDRWSAFNWDSPDELLEVALDDNWCAICLLPASEVSQVLNLLRPDLLCNLLRGYAVNQRTSAREMSLSDFVPVVLDATEELKGQDVNPG